MAYDASVLLASVDSNKPLFLAMGSLAMLFNYIYFYLCLANARRDRVAAYPLVCSTVWFAHDLSFVLHFQDWFHVYNHWYVKLFWLALIPTTFLEILYIRDFWRFGRAELPRLNDGQFNAFVAGSVLLGIVGWYSVKQFLDDPIYAYTFGSTGFMAVAFCLPRMLRRGDAKGQSHHAWIAYTLMQTCWFSTTVVFFGSPFHQPWYLLMATSSITGGIVMAVVAFKWRDEKDEERSGRLVAA